MDDQQYNPQQPYQHGLPDPVQQPGRPSSATPQYTQTGPADHGQVPAGGSGQQRSPLRIDDVLLSQLGLDALPPEEKKALQKHIYETLEMNVGMRLADQMTNEQLDEFEQYFNARDDAGAFRWLETNFPNYKDIVAEEFEKLKGEVAAQAPAILAASQQQAAAASTGYVVPQQYPGYPDQQPPQYPDQPQPPQQA